MSYIRDSEMRERLFLAGQRAARGETFEGLGIEAPELKDAYRIGYDSVKRLEPLKEQNGLYSGKDSIWRAG